MKLLNFGVFLCVCCASNVIFADTILPLKFNTGNKVASSITNLPSTVITIQGEKVPLLFDSGESQEPLTISKQLLSKFKYIRTGKTICGHDVTGKKTCYPIVTINGVKLGNISLNNVQVMVMDKLWGGNSKGFHVTAAAENGVIGYAMLAKFNVLLDYKNHQVELYSHNDKPQQYDLSRWIKFPFYGKLETNLLYHGNKLVFSWDTGSVPSILSISAARDMKKGSCPGIYAKSNCVFVQKNMLQPVGQNKFPATWFQLQDIPKIAGFAGLIGSNFYAHNLVYFDFAHNNIYLHKI